MTASIRRCLIGPVKFPEVSFSLLVVLKAVVYQCSASSAVVGALKDLTDHTDILINGDKDLHETRIQREKNLARARGQICDFRFTVATENIQHFCTTDPKLINRIEEIEVKLEVLQPEVTSIHPVTQTPEPPETAEISEINVIKERLLKLEAEVTELRTKSLNSAAALEEKEFQTVPNATEDELESLVQKLPRGIQLTGVRLSQGSYGRVEVLMNGIWGTVCDDDWDLRHAHVVCRELGYTRAQRATKKGHFGRGKGPIWLDDIRCNGAENSLFNCGRATRQSNDCGHTEDAGAVCSGMPLRLTNAYSGRLEVYHNGRWGTVCQDGWDIYDARVICRQLGYISAQRAFTGRSVSPGSGVIHMTRVYCTGNENNFFDCPFEVPSKTAKVCTHETDAGVECGSAYCTDC